jgi:tetratricopeptide (TPR) repeat protein
MLDLGAFKGKILYFPFFRKNSRREKAVELFHRGVEAFHGENEELSLDLFERVIQIDPSYPAPYETMGVILGRKGNYLEALEKMNQLLCVDPQSILAHTNKSLYLMKLGRIEEAEVEKQRATVKNFELMGRESKEKRDLEDKNKNEDLELSRREQMFKQVLEIDPQDSLAAYGMADILFKRKDFSNAQIFLDRLLEHHPKHSNGYLLSGQNLNILGKKKEARVIWEKGIEVASEKGDLGPANEMQRRLLLL